MQLLRLPGVALIVALALPGRAAGDDARDLVKRAMTALPRVPFVAKMRLTVDAGPPRELRLSSKIVDGARASYLEVLAPLDLQGTRFLFLERPEGRSEQFLSVPVSRKVLQVADTVRKYSFLGSTFYVADLVEPPLNDFTYTIAGEEEILRRRCKLIEVVPKQPAREVYAKTLVAIDLKDALILKRLFLDDQGVLLKVWTVERVEKIDGHWVLRDQRMKNIPEHRESRLEITDIHYDVELPDSMFTPQHLSR